MSRALRVSLPLLALSLSAFLIAQGADVPTPEQRAKAKQQFDAGNFRDAYDIYRKLALDPQSTGEQPGDDLQQAVNCLQRLQRIAEVDQLLSNVVELHAQNWQLLGRAGYIISQNLPHHGFMVAGEFYRGNQRGGGMWVNVAERDHVQALIWFNQARQKMPVEGMNSERAELLINLANELKGWSASRMHRLQALTNLNTLPDYPTVEEGMGRGRFGGQGWGEPEAAPVDADGNPIFYSVPTSFDAAKNDGERWRWCLQEAVEVEPSRKDAVQLHFAAFLHSEFGVQTLQRWGIILPRENDDQDRESAIWSLPSLGEDETIARLTNGVKRFKLPDEFNYIKIYRKLSEDQTRSTIPFQALQQLAQIFENRQQYEKAADCWREAEKHPLYATSLSKQVNVQQRLDQIIGNWGQFEPVMSQPSGSGATVDYRFRNGTMVSFEAFPIKIPELLADIKAYLKTRPKELDWQKLDIDSIGSKIVRENETKYLGEKIADWSLKLDPRPGHYDRRITVTTPLQKGGAYLVLAKMNDGNMSRIILWLNDTAIVKKPLNGKTMYYVADAVTGAPANRARVDFFGWGRQYDQQGRQQPLQFSEFAEFTTAEGMILPDQRRMSTDFQWMAVAKTEQGGFAHLGFSSVWYSDYTDPQYRETKVYVITDRPVYRPDQKVDFKFWVREARYDKTDNSLYAGKTFTIKIYDPRGTEVFKQEMKTDDFGGIAGQFALPKDATLGMYQLSLEGRAGLSQHISGGNAFRVEEYKKPEFEVTVEAPSKPVQLGEKITATIKAKYYYGAPVTQGKVKFKVERTQHDARWFPSDRWDWLYGNGFWWFTPDSTWYPGFSSWGCLAPRQSWAPWSPSPPELVLDQELPIGPDGTVQVEIDTSLAKALHGNEDHEYKITAEVTDASRRTIVGNGQVLVSREPFRIFSWTDRGYYRVGDTIEAHFQARTLDGKGVKGTGKLRLLKIRYENGKPIEEVAQEWELATDDEGEARQTMKASQGGQYRVSFKLKTGPEAPEIEGGQLFTIRGQGFDGAEFQFNDLELIADKKTYNPGDKVKLLINTNRLGSTVLLFVRPTNGVAAGPPQVLRIEGKSTEVEIDVQQKDMPNFFVEAVTISAGKLYDQVRDLVVPPESRVLNVEVTPSADRYLPGEKATVDVKVTGPDGNPFQGSVVLSVYDRAVEYISGGSNVEDIKAFFWKWQRHHHPQTENNLVRQFFQLLKQGETPMANLGVFGGSVADRDGEQFGVAVNGRTMRGMGGGMQSMPMAAPMAESFAGDAMALQKGGAIPAMAPGADMVAPTVRTNFADTAFWKADLLTDASGLARVTFDMPENLSAWKLRAWGMGAGTNVGEGTAEAVTRKNIMVRLQAPRFFVETDEVVLSAIVNNDLATEKQVRVELALEGDTLDLIKTQEGAASSKYAPLTTTVTIPAHGETRVDWRVKAVNPGTATVTMKALTDQESDAMQMSFPVYVHGILKTESYSRVIRPDADRTTIEFNVPEQRIPEQSRLEVRYSPTLAGAMVDALPYLADYPYGCTEQTLNRFVPTVITQKILLQMGLDLKAIQEKRTNLNAQQIGNDRERAAQWKQFDRNPVFDADEVASMVKKGVQDLAAMQNSDGGWGWWAGFAERSYPHTTAVVVHGLQLAARNDVALNEGMLENGIAWLKRYQTEQVELLLEGERHAKDPQRKANYRSQASNLDAMVFSVLVDGNVQDLEMKRFLYRDRLNLSVYSQALLGLALHELKATEQRDMVVQNLDQFLKVDEENQTAYLDLPNNNWWFWYGDSIEANAHYLKLLTKVNPADSKAAGLVKYLINNRRHGTYWKSTRDTAYCIEALADYLIATKEMQPNVQVEVWLDGELKQTVEITPQTLFTFDNAFVIEGTDLTAGKHTLELRRKPLGDANAAKTSLYANAYVTNFTKEDFITAAGLEIKVGRKFYKLIQDKDATSAVTGSRGQVIDQSVVKYRREELANLSEVVSGDLIEVELEIDSKNDYEYVIFEDYKAAGCEPVELQSGYTAGGLGAYVEFRDEKVAFFIRQLDRGKHSVSYRLRAEIPGQFSALPATAHAMYAPELKANADEMKLKIEDAP